MIRSIILFAVAVWTAGAQTCTISLSSSSANVPVSGGTYGPINVTASASSCQRGAVASVTWIHITYGNSGTGNGSFGFTVDANTLAATRTGTITSGNAVFTVTQGGLPCNLSLSAASPQVPVSGGTYSFTVTAVNGCVWQAAASASWITITAGSTGTGSGTVSYSVAPNTGPVRSSTVIVSANQSQLSVTVSQATGCGFSISPTSATVAASGGSGTIQVTGGSQCSWTVTSNASWIQFTAPSATIGNGSVSYTVAANAGGDTRTGTLTVASQTFTVAQAGSNRPTISSGGVVSASAFNSKAGVAAGTWLEIFGSNLATTTRSWTGTDFQGNNAPTSLDGVSVTIGGKNAYVDYVSPTQVNVQVPDGIGVGAGVPLILSNAQGQSESYALQAADLAPALLAPPTFQAGGKQYVVATFPANDAGSLVYAGPTGAISGVNTRPAKAGDVVTLYGIGFGPVTPATAAGTIATQTTALNNPVTVLVGQTPATVQYQGLAPGYVGLYQFNVLVPSVSAGDAALTVQVGGTQLSQTLYLTIGQ